MFYLVVQLVLLKSNTLFDSFYRLARHASKYFFSFKVCFVLVSEIPIVVSFFISFDCLFRLLLPRFLKLGFLSEIVTLKIECDRRRGRFGMLKVAQRDLRRRQSTLDIVEAVK